ncbi:MAG: TerB family tellurite resistance protein [Acidobacteriota bacterium]|nr:TerB family tellurite resistance protein [Acidobacteriota bacterium]
MSIWDYLGLGGKEGDKSAAPSSETETVRKIVDALDRMEPEQARYIAAFAYILSRVANADLEITPEETRAMERIVSERGGLPEEQAIMVVQMAKTQNLLFGGTEDYLVTREFGKIADRDQKTALLHCLFSVSAVDESIVSAEDTEIRKIASEIKLSHAEFIAVKSQYSKHLETLKDDSDA